METYLILTIVAGVFVLLGIVFGVVGFMWWQNVRHFVQTAERAEGTVIELTRGGKGRLCPVVEYTDRFGQRQKHRSKIGSTPPSHSVGDKVQILYDQNDIVASARINHWLHLYFFPGLCLFFAFDFIAMAAVFFVVARFVV